jgi:hypothetical protein
MADDIYMVDQGRFKYLIDVSICSKITVRQMRKERIG